MTSESKTANFPLNAWYAVAYDVDVKRTLLARTICNKKVVLYRQTDGTPVALEDACWHRLLPLSMGRLDGDTLVCGYHGLVFNASGRCIEMPSQETLNPSACVRSYPVVEKHRLIWLWLGDVSKADPATIPDFHWNEDPAWAGDGETIHAKCDYRLVVDNLMDLTHEAFVHVASLHQDELAESPFEVTYDDKFVTVSRWMHNVDAPSFWAVQLRKHNGWTGKVDRWQIIRFEAPGTVTIDVGVAPVGSGAREGDRSQGVNGYVLNTISPETDTTSHYIWAFCRNYRLQDQGITQQFRLGVRSVFREDEMIVEAQQRAILDHPEREFYNLNIDAGALWARRLIDRMIRAESGPASASAVIPIRVAG
jgi:phenylpropionate dioxygenase-like ring-hydroxylating dioxygenase large terminal subunit